MRVLKINSLKSVKEQPWCDRDYLLFHACFQILVDWVEQEEGIENWRFEEYQTPINTLKSLYDWWKSLDEEYDLAEDSAQEKLEQLVKLRRYLWT
jgi:hypothetical protein